MVSVALGACAATLARFRADGIRGYRDPTGGKTPIRLSEGYIEGGVMPQATATLCGSVTTTFLSFCRNVRIRLKSTQQ